MARALPPPPFKAATNIWLHIVLLSSIIAIQGPLILCSAQPSSLGVHIVRSPESAVAPKGDEVVFECELNLDPDRLAWRFRQSSARATNAKNFRYLEDTIYNITNEGRISKLRVFVSPETLGDYQCVAWYGSSAIASVSARLTLVSISIDNSNGYTTSPIRWTAAPKNCILIRCGTVTSNPPAVWSFYRNGEKVPQQEVLTTNGALILNSVTTKDSGNYTCSAQNAITGVEVKLPQRIDLRVDYMDRRAPSFLTVPPKEVTARPGETVVLECPGVGSPPPEAVWSSPNVANIYNNRTKVLAYGLQISDVLPEDYGTYVCRLDNGIAPAKVLYIKLIVLEKPKILRGPAFTLTNESDSLELECSATGNPLPSIYWLINGEDTALDNETLPEGRRLAIPKVQKRHAGIVQCFAKNEVGEVSEGNLLQVSPLQIQGGGSEPLGNLPTRIPYEHSGNRGKGKRKHKTANMIPPSKPNVTRLSDDSVMLRWNVPNKGGLPIQFFKVQYRMVGDNSRKIPRDSWQTTNEDIPYGKRDPSYEGVKNFTSSVPGLKPDRFYRFRIIAVYSNNDNKEGNTSGKFFLQRASALGPTKSNLPAPELQRIEPLSETAVMLHWTLPANPSNLVDGFYAYYRPSTSAGEYLKATVDGMNTRKFKIDLLEPGTAYEFKLQSFNALAASEFSSILQGRTKKPHTTPSPTAPSVIPTTTTNQEDNSIYPVIAGAAGGGILLLIATIAACLCMKRRKNSQSEDEDKPQLDHIQADFVTPSVLGVSPHHKPGHRLNGVIPRMNITPNPLAQEADKNRNVMELRFLPNNTNNTTSSLTTTATTNGNKQIAQNNTNLAVATKTTTTTPLTDDADDDDANEHNAQQLTHHHQQQRSSSSCETLEASEGITGMVVDTSSPLSKPLPPLPAKNMSSKSSTTSSSRSINNSNSNLHIKHTIAKVTNNKQLNSANSTHTSPTTTANHQQQQQQHANQKSINSTQNFPIHNSQAYNLTAAGIAGSQHGLHHAQPYKHNSTPGTPTMLHKRSEYQQTPPPVPPHQNNNHQQYAHDLHAGHHLQQQQQHYHHAQQQAAAAAYQNHNQHHQHNHNLNHHHHPQQQQQHLSSASPPPLTPSMEHQRRTLDRSARNMHYTPQSTTTMPTQQQFQHHPHHSNHHQDVSMNCDGLPTRIPSLRRTRRSSGNNNNSNGGVGIPIVPGSPRVQRSPMPARAAMMKRNRLGSHNDNISSGSLNSIEV